MPRTPPLIETLLQDIIDEIDSLLDHMGPDMMDSMVDLLDSIQRRLVPFVEGAQMPTTREDWDWDDDGYYKGDSHV